MDIGINGISRNVIEPSACPHCHNGIAPTYLNLASGIVSGQKSIYVIWKCTHGDCGSLFASEHRLLSQYGTEFIRYLDGAPIAPHWPSNIVSLPSKFIKTYMQSLKAEDEGLDEIAGMGYRKAIEYLVKDYVIKKDDSKRGSIEDALLAKVIKENFTEPREADLKDLLERATWLGNDMTHYLKYHENFDINDLKELISLVMDEIHSIEQKKHYIANIQGKYNTKTK